jgi:hypothetical protein
MMSDPDRLICGLATCFGQPSGNDGTTWSAAHFRDLIGLEIAVPLLLNHGILINSWGVTPRIGVARKFAHVTYPVQGLLCLGEIEYADGWGDSILADIRSILEQRCLPAAWGFSVCGLI